MMYKCKKRHSKLKTQPYQINSVFGHEITIFFETQKYSVYLQMKLQIINRVHARITIYKQHEKLAG